MGSEWWLGWIPVKLGGGERSGSSTLCTHSSVLSFPNLIVHKSESTLLETSVPGDSLGVTYFLFPSLHLSLDPQLWS